MAVFVDHRVTGERPRPSEAADPKGQGKRESPGSLPRHTVTPSTPLLHRSNGLGPLGNINLLWSRNDTTADVGTDSMLLDCRRLTRCPAMSQIVHNGMATNARRGALW